MIDWVFLAKIALLILLGFGGYEISKRTGIFEIPIYLGIGILFGYLLHFHPHSHEGIIEIIFHICIVFILFYGGFELSIDFLKKNLRLIIILSTLGILITALITGYATSIFLGWPLLYGLLFGSLISAIDPATLVPLFEQYPVKKKIETLLVSESGYNDATAAVLASTLITAITATGAISIPAIIVDFLREAGVGVGIGAAFGVIGSLAIKRVDSRGIVLAPILLTVALSSYFLSHHIGGSGFMGSITTGLFLKIGEERFEPQFDYDKSKVILDISHYPALLGRICIFVLLGGLVSFSAIEAIGFSGFLVVGALMFVGRPATVIVSIIFGKLPKWKGSWTWKEIGFLSWTGNVRGIMPATLAGIIVVKGIEYSHLILGLTFISVLLTISIQASTAPILINKWGLD